MENFGHQLNTAPDNEKTFSLFQFVIDVKPDFSC